MNLEAKAQLKKLRVAPRKMRLLVDLVRGKKVEDAIAQLLVSKKRASRILLKLMESAVANAVHNHDLKKETLVVKTAFVDEGVTLKRWMPRAMGRATPIRKRTSHTTIVLSGEVDETKKQKLKAKIKKTEVKKVEKVEEPKVEEVKKEVKETKVKK